MTKSSMSIWLLAFGAMMPSTVFAQDDEAPKKKAAPKEEKAPSPLISPRPRAQADQPPPMEEIAAKTGDPINLDEAWRAIDSELNFGTVDEARRLIAIALRMPDYNPTNLVDLREQYGSSMLVTIAATPQLGDAGRRFLNAVNEATRNKYRDPVRIRRYLGNLEKSPSEQAFAVEELRKSGDATAPSFAEAILANPNKPIYAQALSRMPPRLWEAVAAMLDGNEPALQSAALDALAAYRINASAEALYHPLASKKFSEALQSKAQYALGLLGKLATPPDAIPELTNVANDYYLGRGGRELQDTHDVWSWKDGKLIATPTPAAEAAYLFGLDAAKKAYDLDANNITAQTTLASILLSKPNVRALPQEIQALNRSEVLSRVIAQAEIDRRGMTARNAVAMLALTDDAAAFHGLTTALNYPNTEVQFAAAQAVLRLKPTTRFRSYERIVPILIRALRSGPARAAVVADGDLSRGNRTGNLVRGIGSVPRIAASGREAFKMAAEFGDVELIVLEPTIRDPDLNDTLTQLRLDARTSGIPVVVFEFDPPDFAPPVVVRPVTEAERKQHLRKQDHQVYLEEARTELYGVAALAPERENRTFTVEQRVEYLLKRMGYITDPAEYRKLMAEIPREVAVKQNQLLDPLEIQQIREWYGARVERLEQLRDRHPNVILLPRVGKAETFAKGLALFAPAEDGGPLTQDARFSQQEQALEWLKRIAVGEFSYLDVRPAAATLADLLVDSKAGPVAAEALALIPSPTAQARLADVALAGTQPAAIRVASLNALAMSTTRVGRLVPNRTATQLLAIGYEAVDGPLGAAVDAFAKALGPQAVALVAKYRAGAAARPKQTSAPTPPPISGSPTPPAKAPPKREPTPKKKPANDFD